jgi:hypothetical protein
MTQLVLWLIIAYGLSNIVVYGSIFNGPRNLINRLADNEFTPFQGGWIFLKGMISCMMCFGFHCGWFLSISIYSPVHEILGVHEYASWFFDGMLASGGTWAINSIIEWFEQNRPQQNH